MATENKFCKNCKHWNNKQSELDYSVHDGICTSHKLKFGTTNYADVKLLDRSNITEKYMGVNRFENRTKEAPVGQVERSRYCLVTEETFGCINFTK